MGMIEINGNFIFDGRDLKYYYKFYLGLKRNYYKILMF